jgi:NAD(P)H-dependent FMN reductase
METLKIKVVLASVREGRNADTVWAWLDRQLKQITSFDVELLDLKPLNLPMFDEASPPMRGAPHITEAAQTWSAKMAEADGYIIVTPEYDHTIPGSLRNAFDYLAKEWAKKPAAIVSYGGLSGGMRAAESMKPSLAGMEVVLIPIETNIIAVNKAFDENGELPDNYAVTAKAMLSSLEWWANVLKAARATIIK